MSLFKFFGFFLMAFAMSFACVSEEVQSKQTITSPTDGKRSVHSKSYLKNKGGGILEYFHRRSEQFKKEMSLFEKGRATSAMYLHFFISNAAIKSFSYLHEEVDKEEIQEEVPKEEFKEKKKPAVKSFLLESKKAWEKISKDKDSKCFFIRKEFLEIEVGLSRDEYSILPNYITFFLIHRLNQIRFYFTTSVENNGNETYVSYLLFSNYVMRVEWNEKRFGHNTTEICRYGMNSLDYPTQQRLLEPEKLYYLLEKVYSIERATIIQNLKESGEGPQLEDYIY